MKLTFDDHDQMSVANVKGDLTGEYSDLVRKAALQRMEEQQVRDFVLNLEDTEFIDSQGLETLLWLQDTCGEHLGQVRLACVTEAVRTILEMTRLAARFDSHENVEAAMKSLR